ncbi:MAG: signal recognition particle protein [Coriobacteriia bacterium]|nr:signal recognition particle protein [Coriobacteriia bacterium]
MFENLAERLQDILSNLRSKGRLSEADIEAAMREIRLALLEADVNFRVVRSFVDAVRERALDAEVLESLTPAQNVVRIVLDQLTQLLGSEQDRFTITSRIPNVIMLVGLQGSGKTTAAAKLAYRLQNQGHRPLLVAADVYRPAAADQLQTLGGEIGVPVFKGDGISPVMIAKESVQHAIDTLRNVVIIDTAGRLHVDQQMMAEAAAIKQAVNPDQILMVVDAMTGQDVVNVATAFAEQVDFDGVIIAKMDGDARGGGALSIRAVTGKPIKFISEGEKPSSLDEFHPDRMARRILGMGDVVSLIERAQAVADEEIELEEAERIARAELTFDDFLMMNQQVKKMGGLTSLVKALPGGDRALGSGQYDEKALDRMEVIINSMTKAERAKPAILNGSRRARIAKGAGVQVSQVNQLIKSYDETRKMIKRMGMTETVTTSSKRPTKKSKGKNKKKRNNTRAASVDMGALGRLSPTDLKGLEELMKQ